MNLRNFFKGKTVLITGHTGFKGGWLSTWLVDMDAKVIGYALDPKYEDNIFDLSNLKTKMIDIRADICDLKKLDSVFKEYNPDIVIHLAAQALVRLSYDEPRQTYETNIMGSINILECARKYNTKSIVMITSDKCYKNVEKDEGYVESDSMSDMDPYSCSKGCIEMIVESYRNSFKMNVATARAGNVIGGGDWSSDRLIPDIIKCLKSKKDIIIRNPDAIRPWQYVLEPLYGYLILAKDQYEGISRNSGWNFGPEKENRIIVQKIVEIMIEKQGYGKIVIQKDEIKHESKLLHLDCTKSKNELGWYPVTDITEAIDFIIEWYNSYENENVNDLCIRQIKKFESKL